MDKRVVRPSVECEVDEEFSHHLEMRIRDLEAEGWSREDAEEEARRRFGDVARWRADCHELGTRRDVEMNRRLWWDDAAQDLRYAFRQLRRGPSFALVAVLALGIAIGANVAVFSVMNGVVLRPLPFPDSDRLTVVWTRYLPPSGFDIDKFPLSGPEALDIRDESRTMSEVGIYQVGSRALTGGGAAAERVRVGFLSAGVLPALDVPPLHGRWFDASEDVADGPAVAILSHGLWTDRFGADPSIVGGSIVMNGVPTEVVGIMPPGFSFPREVRAYLPLGLDRTNQGGRAGHGYSMVGRVADGSRQADLDAELRLFADRWAAEYEHNVAHFPWSQSLLTEVVADAPRVLRLLMSAVGLVLLIACVNIANLLLARGERRHAEVAVRRTLGADGARITRQLATESLVLSGISALFGLALAKGIVTALLAIDPDALPRLTEVSLDGSVLLFALGLTGVTALLFGVGPAYLTGRRSVTTLAGSASRSAGSRRSSGLRQILVASEFALSLVVVILAGLVVRSYGALTSTDPRMDPENLVTFSVTLAEADYPDTESIPDEWDRMLGELRAVPGVAAAGAGSHLPFLGRMQWDFQLDDRPPRADGDVAWNAGLTVVGLGYFEALGIPIRQGRGFTDADGRDAPLVAVVSEAMAARYWPGQSVIGKRFGYEQSSDSVPWITVVGVAPDPVTGSLDTEPYPHVYVPQAQSAVALDWVPRSMNIAVRAATGGSSVLPGVRSRMETFDADLPLYQVRDMRQIVADSFAGPRVTTNLLGAFALVALLLAAVGIYGVISYSVAGRTREIGVRVALGAGAGEIARLILVEGARPVILGVLVGLGGAWGATRLVEALLYGVEPTDPLTFTALPLLLMSVGMAASLLPALRATRVPPTEALRE